MLKTDVYMSVTDVRIFIRQLPSYACKSSIPKFLTCVKCHLGNIIKWHHTKSVEGDGSTAAERSRALVITNSSRDPEVPSSNPGKGE